MLKMSIFVGNVLYPACGQWLELPATEDEIEEAKAAAITADCDEIMISDYEGIKVNEYDNIEEINEIAEEIDNLDDYEQNIIEALIDDGYDFETALEIVQDGDYYYFPDCDSMTDVAYQYCEECGILSQIPEDLQGYFDFEAYGRDMGYNGNFIATDDGYIEVIR